MKHDIKSMFKNSLVYGLYPSVIASGYPMRKEYPEENTYYNYEVATENDWKRASKLGCVPHGSGHDCYLKGIIVQVDMTLTEKMWPQLMRYHWIDFVSSMSTMHMITQMKREYSPYTDERIIGIYEELFKEYMEEPIQKKHLKILYSYPSGLQLTARITTNYLQLKTIYAQRKNHVLPEWRVFCEWIESLPKTKELGVV